MPRFIPGIRLNQLFYREGPWRLSWLPRFPGPSAALIGYGSDVLGFDSERSTDHEWGPRLVIFLAENDGKALGGSIDEVLSTPTSSQIFGVTPPTRRSPTRIGRIMTPAGTGRVHHHVYLHSLGEFVGRYLGVAPDATFSNRDWLIMYQNTLLELTAGPSLTMLRNVFGGASGLSAMLTRSGCTCSHRNGFALPRKKRFPADAVKAATNWDRASLPRDWSATSCACAFSSNAATPRTVNGSVRRLRA